MFRRGKVMKYWQGDKNFPKRKLLYLTFMKVLIKLSPLAKRPPTSFSTVPPRNVGIRPQNFLTCSFNLFTTLV